MGSEVGRFVHSYEVHDACRWLQRGEGGWREDDIITDLRGEKWRREGEAETRGLLKQQ